MVLGFLLHLDESRARAGCACSTCGMFVFFFFVFFFLPVISSFLIFMPFLETTRYRLKYCLKEPVNLNQPNRTVQGLTHLSSDFKG